MLFMVHGDNLNKVFTLLRCCWDTLVVNRCHRGLSGRLANAYILFRRATFREDVPYLQ